MIPKCKEMKKRSKVLMPLITVLFVVISATWSEKCEKVVHPKTHVLNLITTQSSTGKFAFLVLEL
jgi:hypothetical protein